MKILKKRIQRINRTSNKLFEKIKNIDMPLAKITKEREWMDTQINTIETKREIPQVSMKFRKYFRHTLNLYIPLSKMDKILNKVDSFLSTSIINNEIEKVIKIPLN